MSGQRWTPEQLQNQNANFIHNTFNSNGNDLIRNIFREMGTNGTIIVDNSNMTQPWVAPAATTSTLSDLAGLQVGQYADINSNDELLLGSHALPQNMRRSLEGLIAERNTSILAAAEQISRPDNFETIRTQIALFVRKIFQSAAAYIKSTDTKNPSEAEVNRLISENLLNVQPEEDFTEALTGINSDLLAATNPDSTPLDNFKKQSEFFFTTYIAIGRELIKADGELKNKLSQFDTIEKQLGAIRAAAEEDEEQSLHIAYFDYLKKKIAPLNIEEAYKKYLTLTKKWAALRDLALLHRIPANADSSASPTCSICLEDPITVALQPCGHCFCTNCKSQLGRNCPNCRRAITGNQRLYFG